MEYTTNFSFRKPQPGEPALVGDLNYNADQIDQYLMQNRLISAEGYDTTETYNTGDLVVYENVLYKCNDDGVTGVWDASKWDQTNLATEVENGGGGASSLEDLTDVDITTPSDGQALIYDDTNDEWVNADLPDASVTKEVTGNPVTFDDGADAQLVKCVSEITGSQDLHGYDKPWVGGAGKNRLDYSDFVQRAGYSSISTTFSNGVITIINNNPYGRFIGFVVKVDENTDYTLSYTQAQSDPYINFSSTKPTEAVPYSGTHISGSPYTFNSGANNYVMFVFETSETGGTITNLQVEKGNQATTYAPYANICPITAYDDGEIEVRGKNILSYDNIGVNWDGTNVPKRIWASFEVPPGKYTYHVKTNNLISEGKVGVGKYPIPMTQAQWDESGSRSMYEIGSGGTKTVTTDSVGKYLLIGFISNSASITEEELEAIELQCEAGESFTSYEKPNHTTHTATFGEEIYDGEVDYVGGSERADWVKITFDGTESWSMPAATSAYKIFALTISDMKQPTTATERKEGLISSHIPASTTISVDGNMNDKAMLKVGTTLYIRNTDCNDLAEFIAWIAGVQLAYELATPTTSPVTPTNLPIKSLSGYNHIESSTGDLEIEYITKGEQAIIDLIPEGLPEVTSADEGKVATVNSSGEWVADTPSGGHTYSTTPQVVGTWIDGSDIYEVVWHNEFDFWTIPASNASTNFLTISSPQLPYGCVIISAWAIHGVTSHGSGGGTQISPVAITCPNSNSNFDVRQFLTFDFNAKDIIIQYIVPSNRSLRLSKGEISEENEEAEETPIEEENGEENDLDEWLEESEEIEEEVDEGTDEDFEEEETDEQEVTQ